MRKALSAAFVFLAMPALAQAQSAGPAPRKIEGSAPLQTYETDLGGLSKVLGAAHYIRILCQGRGDQFWRQRMAAVMALEGPPGTPRRVMMSQNFNVGYRETEERFSTCSPEAQAAEGQFKTQGIRYSQALAARYKN
jgi:uncharacterized protein (TIGR02301 family)